MYINYNKKVYGYRKVIDCKKIVTKIEEKSDGDFYKHGSSWVKVIDETDPNIQDIYDVKFYIKWDSHLKNVTKKWHIETCNYFPEGIVRLCHEGYLPGWKIIEKGLSEIYLKPSKIEGYSVEYIYVVKDGKKLSEPLVIEQKLDMQEFDELIEMYRSTNI